MKCRRIPKRLRRFLSNLGLLDVVVAALTDPRHRKGRHWPFRYLVEILLTGALVQAPSLAEVERLSEQVGLRIPDSSLSFTLARIDPAPLRGVLRQYVRRMIRAKTLRPERLPFGVLAIDGKTSWTGAHAGDVEAQRQGNAFTLRWMRAVLTSARSRPCIDQDVIPAKTNEMGHFPTFWKDLLRAYSRIKLISVASVAFASTNLVLSLALLPGYKMFGVILSKTDGGNYFLKLTGPKATVAANAAAFRKSFGADAAKETEYEFGDE